MIKKDSEKRVVLWLLMRNLSLLRIPSNSHQPDLDLTLWWSMFLIWTWHSKSMGYLNWHYLRKPRIRALFTISCLSGTSWHWGCRDEQTHSPILEKLTLTKQDVTTEVEVFARYLTLDSWPISLGTRTTFSAPSELSKKNKFLGICLWQNGVYENFPSLLLLSWVYFRRWLFGCHHLRSLIFTPYSAEAPFAQRAPSAWLTCSTYFKGNASWISRWRFGEPLF